jgi:hypothetical protein
MGLQPSIYTLFVISQQKENLQNELQCRLEPQTLFLWEASVGVEWRAFGSLAS